VDEAAGIGFLDHEQDVGQEARREMERVLDSERCDVRNAALAGALHAWRARYQDLLPRMRNAVAAAQQPNAPSAASARGQPGSAAVPLLALQRDVAVSAVGCCAAPQCCSSEAVWSWQPPQYLCRGCGLTRYCG